MKKTKLFLSIMAFCFSLAVLCFGVYAAGQVNYTLSGSISYVVSDVFVELSSGIYYTKYNCSEKTDSQEYLIDFISTTDITAGSHWYYYPDGDWWYEAEDESECLENEGFEAS